MRDGQLTVNGRPVWVKSTAPLVGDGIQVGDLWYDTTNSAYKSVTVATTDPITTTTLLNISGALPGIAKITTSGTATPRIGGHLYANTTTATTSGIADWESALGYVIPASTLNSAGDTVEFTAWGTTAANSNTKQTRILLAGNIIIASSLVAASGEAWVFRGVILRTGANSLLAQGSFSGGTLFGNTNISAPFSITLTSDATLGLQIYNTTTAGDITAHGLSVKYYPV